jgi:L-alanine-DL-glutamate epimerase-like enolase superfamily enzyme
MSRIERLSYPMREIDEDHRNQELPAHCPRAICDIVKIETDAGVYGWARPAARPGSTAEGAAAFPQFLVGMDPMRIEHIQILH